MATNLVGTGKLVGAEVRRVEDPRVLLGKRLLRRRCSAFPVRYDGLCSQPVCAREITQVE